MQTNLWNIRNSKERLGIRERTQAQKYHLINLIKTKSKLDDKNKEWKVKSLNTNFKKKIRESILKDNKEMVQRIWQASKSQGVKTKTSSGTKFTKIITNLQNVATLQRESKSKVVEKENGKMFARLINTSSTFSRRSWLDNIKSNQKYKLSMSRNKYSTPDYSQEVNNIIKNRKMTFKHLELSRCGNRNSTLNSLNSSILKSYRV